MRMCAKAAQWKLKTFREILWTKQEEKLRPVARYEYSYQKAVKERKAAQNQQQKISNESWEQNFSDVIFYKPRSHFEQRAETSHQEKVLQTWSIWNSLVINGGNKLLEADLG